MKSRLLVRLDTEIRGASHAVVADCLRFERAAFMARLGEARDAAEQIADIQERYTNVPNAVISAWSNFAEAMVAHCRGFDGAALDKMKRSQALGKAIGLRPLQALSAAWLAHFAQIRMDIASMASFVAEAMQVALPEHHAARACANLVIARAYDEGGRLDIARSWYSSTRYHAATEGDDAILGSLMWTMGSLRVTELQHAAACGPVEVAACEHALLSVESTAHFDEMLGVRGRAALHPMLRAQVCMLLGRTAEALALYDTHLREAAAGGMHTVEGALLADRAWCRLQAGRETETLEDVLAAEACLLRDDSSTNLVPGHARLALVYATLGDASQAHRHRALAACARAIHRKVQSDLMIAMDQEFAVAAA